MDGISGSAIAIGDAAIPLFIEECLVQGPVQLPTRWTFHLDMQRCCIPEKLSFMYMFSISFFPDRHLRWWPIGTRH